VRWRSLFSLLAVGSALAAWGCAPAAESKPGDRLAPSKTEAQESAAPPAPKVSSFAPAEDLERQVERYLKELANSVATEEDYNDSIQKIGNDANTLVVLALALGLHDRENKYQSRAGAMMEAARELAAAKEFESARRGVAALHDAAEGKRPSELKLKWEKTASLPELMKEVPLIHNRLKRAVKGASFTKRAKDSAGMAAAIAAIAQGSLVDTSAAKNAEQVKQWREFSAAMRDGAAAVSAAIRAADEPAAADAMKKLNQSCDDCHAVFHPGAASEASVKEQPGP